MITHTWLNNLNRSSNSTISAAFNCPSLRGIVYGTEEVDQIQVFNLNQTVETLKQAGCHFRSEIINGNGGRHILVNDPSGNPVELFEPA